MARCRVLALLLALLLVPVAHGADPFRFPEGRHGKAVLKYHNKMPMLIVEGTPEEIGAAVGKLALKPAPKVLDYPKGLMEHFSAGLLWNQAVAIGKAMARSFPADYQKELEAMADGAGVPRDKLIAGNTLFDVKKVVMCSALTVEAERSTTGGPLLGRNLDYPSLGYIHEYTLVTVYRPKGKHAFVAVGFPGLVGCLSGMNDAGLAVAVLESFGARQGEGRFNSAGVPYGMCFRTLLEECTTIDEAKKRLEKMSRTTILNLVVADTKGTAVLEITPKSVVVRRPQKGMLSCTNHFCSEVKPAKPVNLAQSFERFAELEKVRATDGKLGVEDLRKHLDAVNLGDLTLQTMVFEPTTLKLHLAFGECPSSSMKLRTLELASLLKAKQK